MEQESQELAQDIKENELINPPVVIPEQDGTFTLLAGERRLKAMKQLGYQQVEVRAWKTLTDEEKLNIEISENAVRKPFSWSENIEAANRLLQVKSADARRRQESTRFGVATTESFLTDGTVNPISARSRFIMPCSKVSDLRKIVRQTINGLR